MTIILEPPINGDTKMKRIPAEEVEYDAEVEGDSRMEFIEEER